MKIRLESLTGKKIDVNAEPGETIKEVKQRVSAAEGIGWWQQMWILHGVVLDDDKMIRDYPSIQEGTRIKLTISLRSGTQDFDESADQNYAISNYILRYLLSFHENTDEGPGKRSSSRVTISPGTTSKSVKVKEKSLRGNRKTSVVICFLRNAHGPILPNSRRNSRRTSKGNDYVSLLKRRNENELTRRRMKTIRSEIEKKKSRSNSEMFKTPRHSKDLTKAVLPRQPALVSLKPIANLLQGRERLRQKRRTNLRRVQSEEHIRPGVMVAVPHRKAQPVQKFKGEKYYDAREHSRSAVDAESEPEDSFHLPLIFMPRATEIGRSQSTVELGSSDRLLQLATPRRTSHLIHCVECKTKLRPRTVYICDCDHPFCFRHVDDHTCDYRTPPSLH